MLSWCFQWSFVALLPSYTQTQFVFNSTSFIFEWWPLTKIIQTNDLKRRRKHKKKKTSNSQFETVFFSSVFYSVLFRFWWNKTRSFVCYLSIRIYLKMFHVCFVKNHLNWWSFQLTNCVLKILYCSAETMDRRAKSQKGKEKENNKIIIALHSQTHTMGHEHRSRSRRKMSNNRND